jgi:hypothetical protein
MQHDLIKIEEIVQKNSTDGMLDIGKYDFEVFSQALIEYGEHAVIKEWESQIEELEESKKVEGITSSAETENEFQDRNNKCIGYNKALDDQIAKLKEKINNAKEN